MAGNWKMHLGPRDGAALARAVAAELSGRGVLATQPPQIILCPPFVSLGAVAEVVRGSAIGLGAQNMHWERQGAFTGEVSGEMLVEIGCSLDEARVALRLRSPTRKITLDALQKPPSGARFLRAVLEALEPHLRATGRLETAA